MSGPLILNLREKVESICLDEIQSTPAEQKHILNLFWAMLKCLGTLCKQNEIDLELEDMIKKNQFDDFCKVALRLSKSFVIPDSIKGLETRLEQKNITLNDLYLFDKLETKEQMYKYMQRLWLRSGQINEKSTNFYKLLIGIVVGFGLVSYASSSSSQQKPIIENLAKYEICPIRGVDFIPPSSNYKNDNTFNTLPYILWIKMSSKYIVNNEMSKNAKIEHLANILISDKNKQIMLISEWKKLITENFPQIKFNEEIKFDMKTRIQLQKYYNTNPNSDLSLLYWTNWMNELEKLSHSSFYYFPENVLQWFHGHALTDPELQPLLCEMFQVYPECHDAFCFVRNLFFKKEIISLQQLTLKEIEVEKENEKTINEQILIKQIELQRKQLLKYKVQEVTNLLPESHKRQLIKKYASLQIYPASAVNHILLQFLNQHKRSIETIDELAKSIIEFTPPHRIRINKSEVRRKHWIFPSSSIEDMIQTWKQTWQEEKYPHFDSLEDPISFLFRMRLRYNDNDVELEQLNIQQNNEVRDLSELYQLNFIIDVYRTLRNEYGNSIDCESIFILNTKQWFARQQLSHSILEPFLTEIFDLDHILSHEGRFY